MSWEESSEERRVNPFRPPDEVGDASEAGALPPIELESQVVEKALFPLWARWFIPIASIMFAFLTVGLLVGFGLNPLLALARADGAMGGRMFISAFGFVSAFFTGLFSYKGLILSRYRNDRYQFIDQNLWLNQEPYATQDLILKPAFGKICYLMLGSQCLTVLDMDLSTFKDFELRIRKG